MRVNTPDHPFTDITMAILVDIMSISYNEKYVISLSTYRELEGLCFEPDVINGHILIQDILPSSSLHGRIQMHDRLCKINEIKMDFSANPYIVREYDKLMEKIADMIESTE